MELEYLKKLEDFYNNNLKFSRISVPEQKIEKLEQQLNIKLPKAYKEFLFLAGNRDSFLDSWERGFDYLDWIQASIKKSINDVNLHLKPFFAFEEYGRNQCQFFFLDEGENPPIYAYYEDKIENDKGEEVFYKKTKNSFSDLIESRISYTLKNG